jgi:hypothetical protein
MAAASRRQTAAVTSTSASQRRPQAPPVGQMPLSQFFAPSSTQLADKDNQIKERLLAKAKVDSTRDRINAMKQAAMRLAFDDSDEITVESKEIPLTCPISTVRMNLPVRGESCRHTSCFDLESWIEYVSKTRRLRDPASKCPICRLPVQASTLVVDTWILSVLKETAAKNVRTIVLYPNGKYCDPSESRKRLREQEEIDLMTQVPQADDPAWATLASNGVRIKAEPTSADKYANDAGRLSDEGAGMDCGHEDYNQRTAIPEFATLPSQTAFSGGITPQSAQHGGPQQRLEFGSPATQSSGRDRISASTIEGGSGVIGPSLSAMEGLRVDSTQDLPSTSLTEVTTGPSLWDEERLANGAAVEIVVTQSGTTFTQSSSTQSALRTIGSAVPLSGALPYCLTCRRYLPPPDALEELAGGGTKRKCPICGEWKPKLNWSHVLELTSTVDPRRPNRTPVTSSPWGGTLQSYTAGDPPKAQIEVSLGDRLLSVRFLRSYHSSILCPLLARGFFLSPDARVFMLDPLLVDSVSMTTPDGASFRNELDYLRAIVQLALNDQDVSQISKGSVPQAYQWWKRDNFR